MKNIFTALFFAFSFLSFAQEIQFEKTLNEAFAKAKQENKSVFIEYYSPSCPICKKVAFVLKDAKVVEYYNKNFVNYALNIDNGITKEEENFMKSSGLHLDGVPVFLFFDANKNYLHHSSVKADANTIMEIGRVSLHPNLRNAALAEKYQKGDRTIKTLYAYANLLLTKHDFEKQKEVADALYDVFPKADLSTQKSYIILKNVVNAIENGFFLHWIRNLNDLNGLETGPKGGTEKAVLERILLKELSNPERKYWPKEKKEAVKKMIVDLGLTNNPEIYFE
jgi:thiol-disulfide isomerase/thioredoxin